MRSPLTVLLVSVDPDSLGLAMTPFLEEGYAIASTPTVDSAVKLLDPNNPPVLVVLDTREEADDLRLSAMRILKTCAFTQITAVTNIDAQRFHDAMEGLGMLAPLPKNPQAADGARVLTALKTLRGEK
ncbi:MAG: hypothetical protein J5803_06035 [Desulfovibrio sp.]|nr:hypothetical protein [Desulfovibrio sp.]